MNFRPTRTLRHIPPKHTSYTGAYAPLACCPKCLTLSLRADIDELVPCRACGGVVITEGLYGQWKQIPGGVFHKNTGEWHLTEQAAIIIASFL